MLRPRRRRRLPDSITFTRRPLRHAAIIGLAIVGLAAIFWDRSAPALPRGNDHSRYHDRVFRVTRVVDGDTFDIAAPDGDQSVTRIRLWGVDAPETGKGPHPAMHFGAKASAFADESLDGRNVRVVLSPQRTRGKYGRLLAYVHLEPGGRMFNEVLLEEGYAYADYRFKHHYYRQFKDIEKRARRAERGLWDGITIDQMPPWRQTWERRADPVPP